MDKSTSYRHLQSFEERHNCKLTKEDLIDIINVMQLYLKFEEKGEMNEEEQKPKRKYTKKNQIEKTDTTNESQNTKISNETTKKTTKKTTRKSNITPNISQSDDVMKKIRNMRFELGRIPSAEELKQANVNTGEIAKSHGGWSNLKKKLRDNSEEEAILNLMEKLGRIPTREDLKENNVSIENLMLQYGSWREIKKSMNIATKYEEMLKNKLVNMKQNENLTMDKCKSNGIDIAFLIRKYGGWKTVLRELQLA